MNEEGRSYDIRQVLSRHPPAHKRVVYFICLWYTYSKILVSLAWATYCFGTFLKSDMTKG